MFTGVCVESIHLLGDSHNVKCYACTLLSVSAVVTSVPSKSDCLVQFPELVWIPFL